MRNRLLLLDLLLAAAVVWAAFGIRDRWLEARKRERVVLGRPLVQAPPPPYAPAPEMPPLKAAEYSDVAQKTLFSPDRNPTIIVEVAPPKPMPALPVVFGVMDLGDGPLAIMAAKATDVRHKEIRAGDKIGDFTMVEIAQDQLVLEWDGKKITRRVSDLIPKPAAQNAPAESASAPKPQPGPANPSGPGHDLGGGWKACDPRDPSPDGTVRDGWKKVIRAMPIGQTCHWEPAK